MDATPDDNHDTTHWTNNEIQALVCVWGEENIQKELEGAVRNEKIFKQISRRLSEMGVERSSKQCREKIKKMKQDYKKIKDHNSKSDANRKTNKWYDALDAILGPRPVYAGSSNVVESATALLQAIANDEPIETQRDARSSTSSPASPLSDGETSTSSCGETGSTTTGSTAASTSTTQKRKRSRDVEFLEAMKSMEKEKLDHEKELQREQLEMMEKARLEDAAARAEAMERSRLEEAALREQEMEIRRQEARENALFQQGFLSVLGRLVDAMSKK